MVKRNDRWIDEAYLQQFVNAIRKGGKVQFVQSMNYLAVDHAELGWLVVELADNVKVDDGQDSNSS